MQLDRFSTAQFSEDRARQLLREVFGYAEFRGQQEAIIAAAVAGDDSLVLMPTGGGKSLCYQIPALVRDGVGIVVSPLIALMEDQVSALREAGVAAAFLNSTLRRAEQSDVIADLRHGRLKLLYLAPERLLQEETQALLREVTLSIIAIDEAHCVSQWGHDFRAEYLGLNVLKEWFPGVPRMALTATATLPTRAEIVARLDLDAPRVFVSSFDRPNIRYAVQRENRCAAAVARVPAAPPRRVRHRLLPVARQDGEHRRVARGAGVCRAAVSRRPARRDARGEPAAVSSWKTR